MDCSQFEEVLHELDRPGAAGAALREDALAHAEMCSDCGALVTEVESLDFSLGQIAEESADVHVPPNREALLRRISPRKSRGSFAPVAFSAGGCGHCGRRAFGFGAFVLPDPARDAGQVASSQRFRRRPGFSNADVARFAGIRGTCQSKC